MRKKGFTLIELLAVLVILAIIALITIPIVLKTISNSEAKSEMQSIIGYARVIEDNIQNDMMLNPGRNYSYYNDKLQEKEFIDGLKYKGNKVTCSSYSMDENGELELRCCKIEGGTGTGYDYKNNKLEKNTDPSCNANDNNNNNQEQQSSNTAVAQLLNKSNGVDATYESGTETSHQMYAFEHPATGQTPALTDYRYIGNDPYNYVDFNGETWRIIGIFTVEDENGNTSQRIKIIKDEKLSSKMAWDSNGVNEWTTASLNAYLNGDYYSGLSSTAKEMISPAKTYLGGRSYDSTTHYGGAEDMYAWERGTDRYDSSRSLNDTKNISLIYPSDYTYTYGKGIDNTCYSDENRCSNNRGGNPSLGWLYKSYYWWTVSPLADNSLFAFYVYTGSVYNPYAYNPYGVRPVTYLISDISFEGNHIGSSTDHYQLKK